MSTETKATKGKDQLAEVIPEDQKEQVNNGGLLLGAFLLIAVAGGAYYLMNKDKNPDGTSKPRIPVKIPPVVIDDVVVGTVPTGPNRGTKPKHLNLEDLNVKIAGDVKSPVTMAIQVVAFKESTGTYWPEYENGSLMKKTFTPGEVIGKLIQLQHDEKPDGETYLIVQPHIPIWNDYIVDATYYGIPARLFKK